MDKYIICALIKNEQDYLEEWIQYHLSIGFSEILLFEDIDSVSHKDITDKYPKVRLHNIKECYTNSTIQEFGGDRQYTLYSKILLLRLIQPTSWIAFIDADEYITLAEGETLESVCKEFKADSGIAMYWKMYNSSGRICKVDSILNNYTTFSTTFTEDDILCYKSFVNLSKAKSFKNHHKIEDAVDERHIKITDNSYLSPSYNKIWIRHYYTKSVEDWIYKFRIRHTLCLTHREFDDFFDYNPELSPYKDEIYNIYLNSNSVSVDLKLLEEKINLNNNDTTI